MFSRESQLRELMHFITDCETKVEKMLEALEWTAEETVKDCKASESTNSEPAHDSKVSVDDPLYPPAYPWEHSITFDEDSLNGVIKSNTPKAVPNKFSDSQVNFNREEKLLIYEHVIKRTGKLLEPELSVTFNQEEGSKRQMTFAEIVAMKRDLKRRRMKHRTTKAPPLSHTEEVRNLIDFQMQALKQYLHPEKPNEKESDEDVPERNRPGASRLNLRHEDEKATEHCKKGYRSRSRSREKYSKKKESKKRYRCSPTGEKCEGRLSSFKRNPNKTKRLKPIM